MGRVSKPILAILAAVLALLAVLWAYTVCLEPYRIRQEEMYVTQLAQAGALRGVHVRYEGRCTATDRQGNQVELTAMVCDPESYDSREAVTDQYARAAKERLYADLQAQAEARALTPSQTMTLHRIIEE